MKKYIQLLTVIFIFLSSEGFAQISSFFTQNYEMKEQSITVSSYNLLNFSDPGGTTGLQARYNWHNAQNDQSAISFGITFPKNLIDTFTAVALPGNKPPIIFDSVKYQWKQYTILYHYHRYILETQYDDALAFYISGCAGFTLYNYNKVMPLDRNHYKYTYQYRSSGYSMMGQVAWGTHYQFGSNIRVIGETGPYLFKEKELKFRGQPNDWHMGWNITIGLEFGF